MRKAQTHPGRPDRPSNSPLRLSDSTPPEREKSAYVCSNSVVRPRGREDGPSRSTRLELVFLLPCSHEVSQLAFPHNQARRTLARVKQLRPKPLPQTTRQGGVGSFNMYITSTQHTYSTLNRGRITARLKTESDSAGRQPKEGWLSVETARERDPQFSPRSPLLVLVLLVALTPPQSAGIVSRCGVIPC